MATPAAPAAGVAVDSTPIPYRPAEQHAAGDMAVVLSLTLLALVALVAVLRWMQHRGVLPGTVTRPASLHLVDSLRIGRGTTLSIVEHEGQRLAVVDSPRGVALSLLPQQGQTHG